MTGSLRKHAAAIVVAMVTAAVTAAAPAVAGKIVNADTLSGRSGVGCGASVANRINHYVATCATGDRAGFLPNNIIRKAPDADKLDGLDSTSFIPFVDGHSQNPTDVVLGSTSKVVLTALVHVEQTSTVVAMASVDLFTTSGSASQAECQLAIGPNGGLHTPFTQLTFADFPGTQNYDVQLPIVGSASGVQGGHDYNILLLCKLDNGAVKYDRGDIVAWSVPEVA